MMTADAALTPLAGQLSQTLQAGLVPRQYADWGQRLLQRLQKPVQVVVIGLPGSGKSALIDMLLGEPVLGQCAPAGMIEITFGQSARAEIETAEGSLHHHEGRLCDRTAPRDQGPACLRVRQELPDSRLRGMSLTEIALFGAPSRQQAIMEQAVAYADILLFCSRDFTAPEQALWAEVPDARKDHGFLVLTMADRRIMRGTLKEAIAALEPVATQEFLGLYPLAAIQGLTAQVGQPDGQKGVDRQLWHSSGGKRLYDDLMHQIDLGRTSDLDQAEMLVRQFALPAAAPLAANSGTGSNVGTGSATGNETAAPKAAASRPAEPAPDPTERQATRPMSQVAAALRPGQRQATVGHLAAHGTGSPQTAPRAPADLRAEDDLLAEASAMIRDRAKDLLAQCEGADTPDLSGVFEGALDTVRQLLQTVQPHAAGSEPLRAARDAAEDGEEVLMLCQLEQNEDAAVDAVTLLLQLRRELSPAQNQSPP